MSTKTTIQWTDRTWNPVRGCSRVSPGCDNCYAMNMAHRFSGAGKPFEGLTTIRRGKVDWTGTARFIPDQLAAPLSWCKPQRVFVNSMSDLFHESLEFTAIAAIFGVMAACPQHTFQVLTKRPKRAAEFFSWVEEGSNLKNQSRDMVVQQHAYNVLGDRFPLHRIKGTFLAFPWPLQNIWLGVSVEDQKTADERIPLLLSLPAAVRFISAEPLLGPVDLGLSLGVPLADGSRWSGTLPLLDWVIAGGESGNGARPCALEWLEKIVEQCRFTGVACFVKQLGKVVVSEHRACDTDEEAKRDFGFDSRWLWQASLKDRKGGDITAWPEALRVRQFPGATS